MKRHVVSRETLRGASMDEQSEDYCEEVETYFEEDIPEDVADGDDEHSLQALTDEQLDEIADTAIAILKDLLQFFDVGEVTIDEYSGDEGELILDITGNNLAILIGRHGKTLDALQHIVSAITVRKIGFRFPVIVDIEGYKNRQLEKLEKLALSSAQKALRFKKAIALRPMNAYERRIIHMVLRDNKKLSTNSEGSGANRHIVIKPVKF